MPDKLWKAAERRLCKMLGGTRRGLTGRDESDRLCTELVYADELRTLRSVAKAAREVVFMPSQDNPAWDRLTIALDRLWEMREVVGDG